MKFLNNVFISITFVLAGSLASGQDVIPNLDKTKVVPEIIEYRNCPNANNSIDHNGYVMTFELKLRDEENSPIIKKIHVCIDPYRVNYNVT